MKKVTKHLKKLFYLIVIALTIFIFTLLGKSCGQVYLKQDISASALVGNFYGTFDETKYLYFYEVYLIEYDKEFNEKFYEYSISNKYITLIDGLDQSEVNKYYIIDENCIYDYLSQIYLYKVVS